MEVERGRGEGGSGGMIDVRKGDSDTEWVGGGGR